MIGNDRQTFRKAIMWEMEKYLEFEKKPYEERANTHQHNIPKLKLLHQIVDFYFDTHEFYKFEVNIKQDVNDTDIFKWLSENCKHPYFTEFKTVFFTSNEEATHFKLVWG